MPLLAKVQKPGKTPGLWFNIKMLSYQYRKSHCGDKTVVRSSYLHNGISYTGKTASLYWFSPQSSQTMLACQLWLTRNQNVWHWTQNVWCWVSSKYWLILKKCNTMACMAKYSLTVFYSSQTSKTMVRTGKKFFCHIGIVCYLSESSHHGHSDGCHEKFR